MKVTTRITKVGKICFTSWVNWKWRNCGCEVFQFAVGFSSTVTTLQYQLKSYIRVYLYYQRCHKFTLERWCLSCLNCDGPLGGGNIEDGAFLGLLFLQLLKGETCGPRIIFQLRNWHPASIEEKIFPTSTSSCILQAAVDLAKGSIS